MTPTPDTPVRCFTALALHADDRRWLQRQLPPDWPAGLQMVPVENWHLTLHFHGSLSAAALQALMARLDDLAPVPAVTATASHWLDLPRHRPAVRALAMDDSHDQLSALRQALPAVGQAAGQKHPFLPHVSVGRYRRGRGQAAANWPDVEDAHVFHFPQLVLFQSLSHERGVRYQPLWSRALPV